MKNNHATLIGENHEDPNIVQHYKEIFSQAEAANITDVMLEIPPQFQGDLEAAYKDLRTFLDNGGSKEDLISIAEDPETDKQTALLILAAAHGVEPHAVDVGDRGRLDVHRDFASKVREHMKSGGEMSRAAILEGLSEEDMARYSSMMGRTLTKQEVWDITKEVHENGPDKELELRVLEGDVKIARRMEEEAQGRPFIAIFGLKHGGLVDENAPGTQKPDLNGALALRFGPDKVAHVAMQSDQWESFMNDKPDYLLRDDNSVSEIAPPLNVPRNPAAQSERGRP